MKLLFITQKVDRADWLLGFTHSWLRTLAARVERLVVICLAQGETDLPSNVTVISLGKERGASRMSRAIRFAKVLLAAMGQVDGVFAHMSPIFAIAAAPLTGLYRVPLVMWYAHRCVDAKLRLATVLCDAVVTASPESFQLPTNKLRVLGHGIDPALFVPALGDVDHAQPMILAVGRLSPIKRYELLAEAVKLLRERGVNVRCVVAGDEPSGDQVYRQKLMRLAGDLVEFVGAVPHEQIANWYRRSAVTVNLCPTGGLDKAVIESMLCARPIVVTNRTYRPLLGSDASSWLVAENANAVADGLAGILADPVAAQRGAAVVRERALAAHSLDSLIDKLISVFNDCRPG